MFSFAQMNRETNGKPWMSLVGNHKMLPSPSLDDFEMHLANKKYDHAKGDGLCYVWCIFKMVSIACMMELYNHLLVIFNRYPNARKYVRLSDGWCYDGPGLANSLCFNGAKFNKVLVTKDINKVQSYIDSKRLKYNFYVIGQTASHYVLLDCFGNIWDSVPRVPTYVYEFIGYQLYTFNIVGMKARYQR